MESTQTFTRLGWAERELLRREVFLVDQRRHTTTTRLKTLHERETRFKEAEKLRKYGKVKREGGEEGEEDGPNKRPKMSSLVGLPGTGETQEATIDATLENPDGESGVPRPRRLLKIADTRRDRKLMGTILGHLNKSKQESQAAPKAESFAERMRNVESKMNEDREKEREKAAAQIEEEIMKQQELQTRLNKRYEQLQKAHTRVLLEEREHLFSHFLETKTQPKLFFLPSHHTAETKKQVEEHKAATLTKYLEFRKSLDALITDVQQNSIEKLLPTVGKGMGKGMGMDGGGKGRGKGVVPQTPRPENPDIDVPPPPAAIGRRLERDRDDEEEESHQQSGRVVSATEVGEEPHDDSGEQAEQGEGSEHGEEASPGKEEEAQEAQEAAEEGEPMEEEQQAQEGDHDDNEGEPGEGDDQKVEDGEAGDNAEEGAAEEDDEGEGSVRMEEASEDGA